jgi:folate-binding protein YgfZ
MNLQPVTTSALPCGAARLDDWGVIRASGDDTLDFLQGQLTQDMQGIAVGHARLAGYCSPKGRLLATFVAWRNDASDVLLACSADVLPAVLKRLSMFVLRAQCKLADASSEVPLWGLADDATGQALTQLGLAQAWAHGSSPERDVVRLPDAVLSGTVRVPRYLCCGTPQPGLNELPGDAWRWLEARSAVARVCAATADQFVPQMVNLELTGGVSFSKGCYTGQEVVARSQYRGTLKRRAYVVEAEVPMAPGQEIFDEADPGQPAGMVVQSGSLDARNHAALVELKVTAATGATLHLGSAGGAKLTLAEQPYALPDTQTGA